MITVEDVIRLALPPGTTCVAGESGLGREVTWAARIRATPPAFGHLNGGELVLLPVSILPELGEQLQLDDIIQRLSQLGVAGVALLGSTTKAAREAADVAGLPLLALPKGSDIGILERDAARLISDLRREVQHRGQEVLRQLMDLAIAGSPLVDVVQELARIGGRSVALEGRDGRLLAFHAAGRSAPARDAVDAMVQRDRPVVARWLAAYPSENLLLVAHGGVFDAIHAHLVGPRQGAESRHAWPYAVTPVGTGWQLRGLQA